MEVHGALISKEDINQKFLRSLPSSWNQIALIMRNKPNIDEIDIDDLYNNLRVYEDELKRSSGSNSASQNLAFLSSENTGSTNEVSTASGDFGVSTAGGINQVSSTPCMDGDDLEELDLRWQVAMLTVRVKKFIQRTGRNMNFKEKQHVSLDKSKIECYNCHRKGHFARECRSGRNQGRRSYGDNGRSNAPTTESSSHALVAQDGLGSYDWSNDFEVELVNYALMAISSSTSSSSSDNEVNVDAGTQDSYVACSSGKDKGPTQEYILLLLQPHRTRIPVKDVVQMPEDEQVLHDELEKMVTQELTAKAMDDVSRQAFEEEMRKIASQKKAAQATNTNTLSTDRLSVSTNKPFVSTDRSKTPYVSATSTPTGANAGESSFVYLGGKIPIDASTLPNADLPIDPNMPNLEDASDTLLNDGIFNGAYDDDEDVGAVADFNNIDNTIVVSPRQNRTNHKDHQNCLFACFLSQEEPKTISQALQDERWVEAMQEELP
ncbi:ribonuclease H-like domain-containing protein [Tanacetum coccineum]|uniref:Ribonuclease H-like domain-containing protein n=1 Tax=Tanacetum coccineum TaxID=301880 RepID=A0ABQ5CPL4_9ASTR